MDAATDPIAEIFSPPIIEALRSVPNPTEQLRMRLHVLTGDLPLQDVQVFRDAWKKYLGCALRLGFLDGAQGEDLRSRLVGRDDDLFASAMSECLAAWFLAERLHLAVSPRPMGRAASVLEMAVATQDGDINVEVKAPHKPLPTTAVWAGDDSDALRAAVKSTNDQFARDKMNLLVIVPRLPTFLSEEPRGLRRFVALKAFVVDETIRVPIDPATGGPAGPVGGGWRPSGEFVKSRDKRDKTKRWYTRTGGALIATQHLKIPAVDMTYSAMLVHNPSARNPLPPDLWRGVDQFCQTDGQWGWRDAEPNPSAEASHEAPSVLSVEKIRDLCPPPVPTPESPSWLDARFGKWLFERLDGRTELSDEELGRFADVWRAEHADGA